MSFLVLQTIKTFQTKLALRSGVLSISLCHSIPTVIFSLHDSSMSLIAQNVTDFNWNLFLVCLSCKLGSHNCMKGKSFVMFHQLQKTNFERCLRIMSKVKNHLMLANLSSRKSFSVCCGYLPNFAKILWDKIFPYISEG